MISDQPKNSVPHREPFLWITRLMEREIEGDDPYGFKGMVELDLSPSEPVFAGHFPGDPVFPGVLQIEAAAQACLWVLLGHREPGERMPDGLMVSVSEFKFRGLVKPPTTLQMRVEKIKQKSWLQYWKAEVSNENKVCASGHLWLGLNPPSRNA